MEFWLQRLTIYAVIGCALLVALFAGMSAGESDIKTALLICGGLVLFAVYFGMYTYYWVCAIAVLFFPGSFNFLPAGFQAFELMLILGAFRFAFDNIIFRQNRLRLGPSFDFGCLLVVVSILFVHGLQDRFGMKIFGSNVWGGRAYVSTFFGFAVYIILQTIKIDLKVWRWLPLIAFFPPIFDAAIKIATQFVPSLASAIYPLYSGVSFGGGEDTFTMVGGDYANTTIQESRLGALASIGQPVALVILSYFGVKNLWRPSRWIFLAALLGAAGLCILAGYRSSILGFLLIGLAAAFKDFRWKVWIPIAVASMILAGTILYHSSGAWDMPLAAQRSLVFLPGKWDPMVVQSAKGSDEFRFETWEKWERDYFSKNPFFGRGFGFPVSARQDIWGNYDIAMNKTLRDSLLLVGELHNGFISVVDRVGVIGTFFFLLWWIVTAWRIFDTLGNPLYNHFNPALTWVAIYLANWAILYVIGSLKFDSFLGPELVLCGLLVRMRKEAREARAQQAPAEKQARKPIMSPRQEPVCQPQPAGSESPHPTA